MAHSSWCYFPSAACIWRGRSPKGRCLAWLGEESPDGVLFDGLGLVLLRKPGPGHIVRAKQQAGGEGTGVLPDSLAFRGVAGLKVRVTAQTGPLGMI